MTPISVACNCSTCPVADGPSEAFTCPMSRTSCWMPWSIERRWSSSSRWNSGRPAAESIEPPTASATFRTGPPAAIGYFAAFLSSFVVSRGSRNGSSSGAGSPASRCWLRWSSELNSAPNRIARLVIQIQIRNAMMPPMDP